MPRIIGGEYRGLRIPRVSGIEEGAVRPMTDRMRESLFMVLEGRGLLSGSGVRIADLFAGSGAVALEALSRGATSATLCDISRAVIAHLRHALPPPIYRERELIIHRRPAEAFIRRARESYSIIFLDPPYDYPKHNQLLARTHASALFGEGSTIVIHYRRGTALSLPSTPPLTSIWQREFGTSVVEVLGCTRPAVCWRAD